MDYIFLINSFLKGGIETEVINIANELSFQKKKGQVISIKNVFNENNINSLPVDFKYHSISKFNSFIIYFLVPFLNLNEISKNIPEKSNIYITDLFTLLIALKIALKRKDLKFGIYIYHLNEFKFSHNKLLRSLFEKLLKNNFSKSGFTVANKTVSNFYSSRYNIAHEWSRRSLIGVLKSKPSIKILTKKREIDFLLVTRLFPYKKYIEKTLKICKELNLNVTLVGDGPEYENLKSKFPEVNFKKTLNKKKLVDIYQSANFFIGNGTALIESIENGCIPIVVDDIMPSNYSIGLFSEINTNYSYTNDIYSNQKEIKLTSVISDLLASTDNKLTERNKIFDECFNNASQYFNTKKSLLVFQKNFVKVNIKPLDFILFSWGYYIELFIHNFKNRLT